MGHQKGNEQAHLPVILRASRLSSMVIPTLRVVTKADWAQGGTHSVVRRHFADPVISRCEIPLSAGKQSPARENGDCFAALAMTTSSTRDRVHTCAAARGFKASDDVVGASYKSLPVRIR